MIVYKKTPHLRLTRAQVPEPPYWAATTIAPYSPRRAAPIAIDYVDLRASCAERFEVSVCENVRDDLERSTTRHPLHAPVLIDGAEFAEVIFGRGEEALQFAAEQHVAAMQLISARGALPRQVPDDAVIAIAAWPLEFDRIEALFAEGKERGLRWGVVVPIVFPVTTELTALSQLAELAKTYGASFFTGVPVELDATARNALARSLTGEGSEETYELLFHADLGPIRLSTERHIAALAGEIDVADFVTPPRWDRHTNWNAAVLLTLTANRILAMNRDEELAWRLTRSAKVIATLEKPIERVAQAASLSIIDPLDEISVDLLTEWLETGRSSFAGHIEKQWRLRRDSGV
ncbi:MAG: hypothetical protein QOE82_3709 [Thermoanaerobaculia bacterium]|nr:hypothetical protein [Thermoanaerobaculia bacterium]